MTAANAHGRGVSLSIVVPVCDEQDNLEALIAELEAVLPLLPGPTDVIVVDDGSRDASWTVLAALASGRPWLKALRFLGRQGQTAAMAAGVEAATGELVAFLDADLQNDPRDLPRLLEPVLAGEADVVCGWRERRRDPALSRRLPSFLANKLIARALRLDLHDIGCTLKVFRRAFIEDVELYGEMHRFLPAYAASLGARIAEVPVNHRPRRHGESHYGLGRAYRVAVDLLTVRLLNAYGTRPAHFFGKVALAFFGLGAAAFAVVAYRAFVLDRVQSTPLIFFMLLAFMTSVTCLLSGLLAEIGIRTLNRAGGRRPWRVVETLNGEAPSAAERRPVHAGR